MLKQPFIDTYALGSTINVTCISEAADKVVWTTSNGDILFNQDSKYSHDEKYEHFHVEIGDGYSSMIISEAKVYNEDVYICSDITGRETIHVKIEGNHISWWYVEIEIHHFMS